MRRVRNDTRVVYLGRLRSPLICMQISSVHEHVPMRFSPMRSARTASTSSSITGSAALARMPPNATARRTVLTPRPPNMTARPRRQTSAGAYSTGMRQTSTIWSEYHSLRSADASPSWPSRVSPVDSIRSREGSRGSERTSLTPDRCPSVGFGSDSMYSR
jgi:hypothetical protein